MVTDPSVAAIIPVFNGERFIAESIESVLSQTFPRIRCVVIDDGSEDRTPSIVATFGEAVQYIRQENAGVAAARNRGIRETSEPFLAFLDADDVWLPDKIQSQMAKFAEGVALTYTGIRIVDRNLVPLSDQLAPLPGQALRNSLLLEHPYMSIPSTAVARREVLEQIGGFDESLSTSADTDLGCRIAAKFKIACVREPKVLYRVHEMQMHHDAKAMERDMLVVVRKFFDEGLAPSELRHLKGRALANLYFSLALHYRRDAVPSTTTRYLVKSVKSDPLRFMRLSRDSLSRWGKRVRTDDSPA
jgi:glycosyltransferase involved in cell wall biosynthesis